MRLSAHRDVLTALARFWRNNPHNWVFPEVPGQSKCWKPFHRNPGKSGGETMPEWNEKDIVGRAQRGDMEASDALIRQFQERIYATIYHMTSNHEDAADLAQITFIKAIRKIDKFKGQSSFFTWLYRIAVNNTINFIRSKRKRIILSINQMDEEYHQWRGTAAGLVSKDTPQRDIDRHELQGMLNAAMQKLFYKP